MKVEIFNDNSSIIMADLKIIYRISEHNEKQKFKPNYINNENCLKNASIVFSSAIYEWKIICDNVTDKTKEMIQQYLPSDSLEIVSLGSGSKTFNLALDMVKSFHEDDSVYLLENDYLHLPSSDKILLDGLNTKYDYVTLYDHPDKYWPIKDGGNPLINPDGSENTTIFTTGLCHWKIANSTTGTFATKVKNIKDDESILRKWTSTDTFYDFQMFIDLSQKGKKLISCIPGYSTHGHNPFLSPFINWELIANL